MKTITVAVLGAVIVGAVAFSGVQLQRTIRGTVEYVIDGDTFRLNGERIRLWGIDAPELSTMDGKASRNRLNSWIIDQHLRCVEKDVDRYRRIVAQCYIGDQDIAGLMVGTGWAKDWPKYSNGYYRDHEEAAQSERLGMWSTGR